jgi:hypothetical protein
MSKYGLEETLAKATQDAAYHPAFYKSLLQSDIYVLAESNKNILKQKDPSENPANMSVVVWLKPDGSQVIPIFTSKQELLKAVKKQASFIRINAKVFFESTSGSCYVLNPASQYGKELLAAEIKALLDGSLFQTLGSHLIERNTNLMIGQPAEYPEKMAKSLKLYFKGCQEVQAAYLAQIYDGTDSTWPHLIIAIRAAKEMPTILQEAALVVKPYITKGSYIDFFRLDDAKDIGKYFLDIQPFYTKGKS